MAELEALSGDIEEIEQKLKNLAFNHLQRELLFVEGDFDEALKVFGEVPQLKIDLQNYMSVQQNNLPFNMDFAARAMAGKGDTAGAIAEYERLVSPDPALRQRLLAHPLARVRLAALYAAQGKTKAAITQYEEALRIWKDADADLGEVIRTRRKLASLKTSSPHP